jgi:ribosomal protein S18 acetylase RimI-like enzyme
MIIKETDYRDLKKVALCHKQSFPGSLSSAMGLQYLQKMFTWYLDVNKAFLFHIEDNGECVGYCGGIIKDGTLTTGSASGMMQHSFNAAIKAFALRPYLIFHKEVRKKYPLLVKNLLSRVGIRQNVISEKERAIKKQKPEVGLVVIGVLPEYRGKGISTELMRYFEVKAKENNIYRLQLSVLRKNNRAIGAYKKNGWIISNKKNSVLEMIKVIEI